jgi:hypothetical protein
MAMNRGKKIIRRSLSTLYILTLAAASAFAQMQTSTPALVGEWKFDEGSGQEVLDTSGNNNNGTLGANSTVETSDPAWTAGKVRGALRFDGIDDYVAIAPSNSLNNLPAFTLEAWIYPTSHADRAGDPSEFFDKGDSSKRFMFDFDGSGGLMGQIRFTGNSAESHSWEVIPLNQWTHVVMTLDAKVENIIRLYINGRESNYYSQTAGLGRVRSETLPTSLGWLIGCRNRTYRFFEGKIDEVRIYSEALTLAEVLERYNAGMTHVLNWRIVW